MLLEHDIVVEIDYFSNLEALP